MIVSKLQDSGRIESLHPLFKMFFDYVKSHDLLHIECGRITLKGDDLFINNINPECVAEDKQVMEVHRKYIDIHVLLEGKERIGWKPVSDLRHETKPYSEAEDCALYADRGAAYVDLLPGQFLIAYPEDAHAPMVGEGKIRKLIGKIIL